MENDTTRAFPVIVESIVMAGLVPAIRVFLRQDRRGCHRTSGLPEVRTLTLPQVR